MAERQPKNQLDLQICIHGWIKDTKENKSKFWHILLKKIIGYKFSSKKSKQSKYDKSETGKCKECTKPKGIKVNKSPGWNGSQPEF